MRHIRHFDVMPIPPVVRRPIFGPHGRKIVAFLCSWEIIALVPGSPVPTVSETVRRYPSLGWILLGLLGHHWFVEAAEAFEDALEEAVLDMSATLD